VAANKKHLVIAALAKDRPGVIRELSRAITDTGCAIADSRMTVLGTELALILLVSGSWNTIAKLEAMAPALQKKLGLTMTTQRSEERAVREKYVPYLVDIVSLDRPGVVHDVAQFFDQREISIDDMSTWTYAALNTGAPMFSVSMSISLPADLHVGRLRDEFTDFCDELNLDATLEPARR